MSRCRRICRKEGLFLGLQFLPMTFPLSLLFPLPPALPLTLASASCLLTSTAWAGVWSYPDSHQAQAAADCCCPLPRWWRMSPRPYRAPLRSASPTAPHQRTCARTSELMKCSNVTLYIFGRGICWWLVCYQAIQYCIYAYKSIIIGIRLKAFGLKKNVLMDAHLGLKLISAV